MNENTRHFLGCWILVGVLGALLAVPILFGVVMAINLGQPWLALGPLALVIVAVVLTIRRQRSLRRGIENRMRALLQSPSPDEYIAYFHELLGRGLTGHKNRDASSAQGCALVYAYFGAFHEARAVLDEIDWENRLPLFRAAGLTAEAVLCYLGTRDYERGLALARQAQRLGEASPLLPGVRTAAAAFALYVEVGEILCGRATAATVQSLEAKWSILPVTATPLIAWGLCVAYRKMQEPAKAEEMAALLKEIAPHCCGLALPA